MESGDQMMQLDSLNLVYTEKFLANANSNTSTTETPETCVAFRLNPKMVFVQKISIWDHLTASFDHRSPSTQELGSANHV